MWRLLTGGIKAIVAIAALSAAAHWAARREPERGGPVLASGIRDPATTGALGSPRKRQPTLDQRGLQRLLADMPAGR
jgi:hypothetical protein